MDSNYFNADMSAWLLKRMGRFTASEIWKLFQGGKKKDQLFGQGAETYIRTKAAELLTMEVKDEVNFKQGEWGKANELDGVLTMEEVLNRKGKHYGAVSPRFFEYGEYAGCSPDWEIEGLEGADIKCPYDSAEHIKNMLMKDEEDLKEERWEYYCQLQMSMLIRKWKVAWFFSYDPRMVEPDIRYKIIPVNPDPEWISEFNMRLAAASAKVKEIMQFMESKSAVHA